MLSALNSANVRRRTPNQAFFGSLPGLSANLDRSSVRVATTDLYLHTFRATLPVRADVAELVDAHGSGPCGGDPVEVQVLSSAPNLWAGISLRRRPLRSKVLPAPRFG